MLGHTNKATINQRRPLTANMLSVLRHLAEFGRFRDKTLIHQSQKNAMRALLDRGYADWHIEDMSYSLTAAGRIALENNGHQQLKEVK